MDTNTLMSFEGLANINLTSGLARPFKHCSGQTLRSSEIRFLNNSKLLGEPCALETLGTTCSHHSNVFVCLLACLLACLFVCLFVCFSVLFVCLCLLSLKSVGKPAYNSRMACSKTQLDVRCLDRTYQTKKHRKSYLGIKSTVQVVASTC